MLFRITSFVCHFFLRFSQRILVCVLSGYSTSKVTLPTAEEVVTYQACMTENYALLGDVYAAADGLKLYLEQAGAKL